MQHPRRRWSTRVRGGCASTSYCHGCCAIIWRCCGTSLPRGTARDERLSTRSEGQPARAAAGATMNRPSLVVFAPSPLLTITVEDADTPRQEIHLHAGGQGFWVARMAALLGIRVSLCWRAGVLGGQDGG